MRAMDPEIQKIFDELDPVPTGPVDLSPAYLKAVKAFENRPENREGSDKSWVAKAIQQFEAHYEKARLV